MKWLLLPLVCLLLACGDPCAIECVQSGRCIQNQNVCIALHNEDCEKTDACQGKGLCMAVEGKCQAITKTCQASTVCQLHGLCRAVEGECVK